jgi:heme-degrading monooxygenase HmoA
MRSSIANPVASADPTAGSTIIANAWIVADGYQEEFVQMIIGLLEYVRTLDGFIEGEILRGANPTRFVSYVRLRSAQDRQRLFEHSEVRAVLRSAGQIARADLHSYDVLRAFRPLPDSSRPIPRAH